MKKIIFFALLFLATTAAAQKADSTIFLSVSKGQTYTQEQVYNFHESDFILSSVVNEQTGDTVVTFYNDSPQNASYYIIYIFGKGKALKSRYIKINKQEGKNNE